MCSVPLSEPPEGKEVCWGVRPILEEGEMSPSPTVTPRLPRLQP